jgi:hypothetical protein
MQSLEHEPATSDVFLRVGEIDDTSLSVNVPESLRSAIDFNTSDTLTIREFSEDGVTRFVAHSKPFTYSTGGLTPRAVDLVVVADTQEQAETSFIQECKHSEDYRSGCKYLVDTILLPEVTSFPEVLAVVGRGDVFDMERLPGEASDIDVMLLVDFKSSEADKLAGLVERISTLAIKYPGIAFTYDFTEITAKGSHGRDVQLPRDESQHLAHVSLDIISLEDLHTLADYVIAKGGSKRILSPYAANAFINGKVLLDRSDSQYEKLVDKIEDAVALTQ